MHNEIINT